MSWKAELKHIVDDIYFMSLNSGGIRKIVRKTGAGFVTLLVL